MSVCEFLPDAGDPQQPADVAVVMTTTLRPTLRRAVRSVFAQAGAGRIMLAIGIDRSDADGSIMAELAAARPAHVSMLVLRLPYSTSMRHGGLHSAGDGGALRSILSLAANAPRIAYLDDDNAWSVDHLRLLQAAIAGKAWAFAPRLLMDEADWTVLGEDLWHSRGPGRGEFGAQGGFVDPNCLMLDRASCAPLLAAWSETPDRKPGMIADRNLFAAIRHLPFGEVATATVQYGIRHTNVLRRHLRAGQAHG